MDFGMFRLKHSKNASYDLDDLVAYMIFSLKNSYAAKKFMNAYDKQIKSLVLFPYAYREIGYTYQGYAIRIKPFLDYNIFYVVDETSYQFTILRILKGRQDWKSIMYNIDDFSI